MVRRRADVALARLAATERGDVGGRLAAGQLAALARLGALGDLDLELVGAGEVGRGDAEPGRGDLLDPGVVALAVRRRARTTPGPRRPRRCWPRRRRAGCRWSAPGAPRAESAPTLIAETTNRRTIARASSTSSSGSGAAASTDPELVARHGAVGGGRGRARRGSGRARRRCRRRGVVGSSARSRPWISLAIRGENRCASPSARKRANPGSGSRGSRPGRPVPGWPARRRAAGAAASARSAKRRPAGPGGRRREAARDDRGVEVDDVDERAADVRGDGADAHPGEGLAQAGLERGHEPARSVSAGVIASAPRVPASSAASSIARRGWTAVAPTARTIAIAWTSRMSAASTTTSVRPRRPASVSAVWTAPAARIDGIGSRSTDQRGVADERRATSTPRRGRPRRPSAPAGRAPARGRPDRRPRSHVASRRPDRVRPPSRTAPRSPSRSATIGRARRSGPRRRAAARRAARAGGRAPPAGPSRPARARGRWPGW